MVEVNVPNTRVKFKRVIFCAWCFSDTDSLYFGNFADVKISRSLKSYPEILFPEL